MKLLMFWIYAVLSALILLGASILLSKLLSFWLEGDLTSWIQAVGAILAIVAGFSVAIWQTQQQRNEVTQEKKAIVEAALCLAHASISTVNERLHAALMPTGSGKVLSLQGDRTSEMVLAMREFDTSKLPADLLSPFTRIRSHVFAINERISVIFDSEDKDKSRKSERHERLKSAIRVNEAVFKLYTDFETKAGTNGMHPLPNAESISVGEDEANS